MARGQLRTPFSVKCIRILGLGSWVLDLGSWILDRKLGIPYSESASGASSGLGERIHRTTLFGGMSGIVAKMAQNEVFSGSSAISYHYWLKSSSSQDVVHTTKTRQKPPLYTPLGECFYI